jgi:hypothetical protein
MRTRLLAQILTENYCNALKKGEEANTHSSSPDRKTSIKYESAALKWWFFSRMNGNLPLRLVGPDSVWSKKHAAPRTVSVYSVTVF